MKKIIVVLVLIVLLGGWILYKGSSMRQVQGAKTAQSTSPAPADTVPLTGNTVKVIVSGVNYAFSPKSITVNKGDKVQITFVSREGGHNWSLDEFGIHTAVLKAGASETVTFVADKSGTFEYYCSVGTHRQMGMTGSLIVR